MPGRAEGVSEDRLLGGRVVIRQPLDGYRAAIDPALLAAAIPAEAGQNVLDVGAGTGAAALCLAARVPGCRVTGLEIQRDLARLAAASVRVNGLGDRVQVVVGDLAAPPPRLAAASFDHVMANPPYLRAHAADPSPHGGKARATIEGPADLAQWLAFCLRMVRDKGTVTVINRADRLDEILAALRTGAGEAVIFPLWPKADGRPARRVIVRARRGAGAGPTLRPGMVLHAADGRYTVAAEAVLRGGEALPI